MKYSSISEKIKDNIVEGYLKGGGNIKSLSKDFQISYDFVNRIINERGIPKKPPGEANRIYPVDHDYFNKIDMPEKAYFLGLALSDGCITGGETCKVFVLTLKHDDYDILFKINQLLQPTKPINTRTQMNRKYSSLRISSNKICENLIRFGILRRKTFVTTWPDWLSKDLIRPFLQGLWEGDGTFRGGVSLTGTEELLKGVENFLLKELNIQCKMYKYKKENNIRKLLIRFRQDQQKFTSWLYKDVSFYMNRKFLDACKIMSYKREKAVEKPRFNEDGSPFSREQIKERQREIAKRCYDKKKILSENIF